jgi:hypothetical protein
VLRVFLLVAMAGFARCFVRPELPLSARAVCLCRETALAAF